MTMPHVCRCEKCGREMPDLITVIDNKTAAGIAPGFVVPVLGAPMPMGAAVISTVCQYSCTKHGLIPGPDCEHCRDESARPTGASRKT